VTRVERALRAGPRGGHVEHVTVIDDDPTGNLTGFAIRH
jgi:hypothetical protein